MMSSLRCHCMMVSKGWSCKYPLRNWLPWATTPTIYRPLDVVGYWWDLFAYPRIDDYGKIANIRILDGFQLWVSDVDKFYHIFSKDDTDKALFFFSQPFPWRWGEARTCQSFFLPLIVDPFTCQDVGGRSGSIWPCVGIHRRVKHRINDPMIQVNLMVK